MIDSMLKKLVAYLQKIVHSYSRLHMPACEPLSWNWSSFLSIWMVEREK